MPKTKSQESPEKKTQTPEQPSEAAKAGETNGKPDMVQIDDETRSRIFDKMFGDRIKDKPEDKPGAQDKPEDKPEPGKPVKLAKDKPGAQDKPEVAKPESDNEPEPQPEPEPEPDDTDEDRQPFDADSLASAISKGNENLIKALKPEPEKKQVVEDELPAAVARKREIYDKLPELYPDKYKPGLTSRMAKFAKAEADYAKAYEKETGEKFNANDEQHNDWYEENMPQIDPEDMENARIEIKLAQRIADLDKTRQSEAEQIRRELRERDFRSEAPSIKQEAYAPMQAAISEDYAKTSLDELATTDKLAHRIITTEVDRISPFLETISKLERRVVDFDPSNNDHQMVLGLLNNIEGALENVPQKKLIRDGKKWVKRSDWMSLPANQRSKTWIISEQDLRNEVVRHIGNQAKQKYDELKELVGYTPSTTKQEETTKTKPAPDQVPGFLQQQQRPSESTAPSVRSNTQINKPETKEPEKPKTGKDLFFDRLGIH